MYIYIKIKIVCFFIHHLISIYIKIVCIYKAYEYICKVHEYMKKKGFVDFYLMYVYAKRSCRLLLENSQMKKERFQVQNSPPSHACGYTKSNRW